MRSFVVLTILLAGCELQPAPKQQQTPPAVPSEEQKAATLDAAVVVAPEPQNPLVPIDVVPVDAREKPDVSAECNAVGVHVAEVVIANASDPAQRAALEDERGHIIRRTSETCTTNKWPKVSIDCFMNAKTMPEMQICGKDLEAPSED